MKPSAIVGFLLLAAAPLVAQQAPPPAPAPSPSPAPAAADTSGDSLKFPAQVEQVNVDLVVTDNKGQPIKDLTAADFTVLEDGTPQQISSFEAVAVPEQASATPPPRPRISINTLPELQT